MLTAISSAALLDMDVAISLRLESGAKAKQEKFDRLGTSFRSINDAVSAASATLDTTARSLISAADTTQQLSGSVASASEQTSSNVQSVASATGELGSSVGDNGSCLQRAVSRPLPTCGHSSLLRLRVLDRMTLLQVSFVMLDTSVASVTTRLRPFCLAV